MERGRRSLNPQDRIARLTSKIVARLSRQGYPPCDIGCDARSMALAQLRYSPDRRFDPEVRSGEQFRD